MRLDHALIQTQGLKLNLKLMQSMQILQMSSTELIDYLEEQSLENPLMEVVFQQPSALRKEAGSKGTTKDGDHRDALLQLADGREKSLEMSLLSQLRLSGLPEALYRAAAYLAGNLNEDGFLAISLQEAGDALGRSLEEMETALDCLQSLEPAGVGARTLRECLLLQIGRARGADPFAARIAGEFINELAAGKLKIIADHIGISIEQVKQSLNYIKTLNPRPGFGYGGQAEPYFEPDAFVEKKGNQYIVSINENCYPKVSVNPFYTRLKSESDCRQTKSFIGQYAQPIQWLIRSLEQRKLTLSRVTASIIEEQRLFLDLGLSGLKPLTLKAIADLLQVDPSTVSRAIKNKYVQTPRGVYPLKFFFSNSMGAQNEEAVSAQSIKAQMMRLIEEEDKRRPLSDQQITDILVGRGLQISRRTVMKYREAMRIPSSRLRCS